MKTKKVLYAAVGAPVVAARKIGERVEEIRATLNKEADSLTDTAGKRVDVWALEGEKVVTRISDGKVVDEIAAKVDFDQVQEQVSKLRDQLEDMLTTWRASFRPEKMTARVPASATVTQTTKVQATAAKKTPAAKTTRAKKATAAKKAPTAKATAAKKAPSAKKATATKTGNANKATAAKKAPAAKAS